MAPLGDTIQRGLCFLSVYLLTLQIHEHSCTLYTANGTLASDTAGNRRASGSTTSQGIPGVLRFGGREDGGDYFTLLYSEGTHLLLGAKNAVYNLSALTLQENQRIEWSADFTTQSICQAKQRTEEECQNYIKMIVRTSENMLTICGTNAFTPRCRQYQRQPDGTFFKTPHAAEEDGTGRIPRDPSHNNTAIVAGGRLFTATMTEWPGIHDALIYSDPVMTEKRHSEILNQPSFVRAVEYADKVFFFFREVAVEHINCGKAVFSRVAQVCKNDEGGNVRVRKDMFTSFFKTRLNCSLPGEYPFYFDEIQSASEMGRGNYMSSLTSGNRTDMIYAVFNTPRSGISGSAVCAFRFSDIQKSFEGPFKAKETPTSIWLPVKEEEVPYPHPAKSCTNDSKLLSDSTLNFIANHPLMDEAVPAYGGQPILVDTNTDYRLTVVAVHWQVRAVDGRYYDVLFTGTDHGWVRKSVNKGHSHIQTVVIEEFQVFEDGSPVTSLQLIVGEGGAGRRDGAGEKLIAVSRNEVKALPLHRCHEKTTCSSCVALQDPYCMWYEGHCVNHHQGIQSIETGSHQQCSSGPPEATDAPAPLPAQCPRCPRCPSLATPTPPAEPARDIERTTVVPRREIHDSSQHTDSGPCSGASSSDVASMYTKYTLVLAIVLTMFISLFVGFALGYIVRQRLWRRWRRRNSDDNDETAGAFSSSEHKQISLENDNRWEKPTPAVSNNLNTTHNANIYQTTPSTTDTGFMTQGRLPEKQLNIVANALNPPSSRQPNGTVDTKIAPPKKGKTYL